MIAGRHARVGTSRLHHLHLGVRGRHRAGLGMGRAEESVHHDDGKHEQAREANTCGPRRQALYETSATTHPSTRCGHGDQNTGA